MADISLATFSYLNQHDSVGGSNLEDLGWLPIVLVMIMTAAPALGVYPVLNLSMAEVYPSDIRTLAIGITISGSFCNVAANILVYPYMLESFKFYGTFYFYALMSLITMFWGFFNIPDNRGLSLAKVEQKAMQEKAEKNETESNVE